MFRLLLSLIPALILYSAAHAASVTPDLPGAVSPFDDYFAILQPDFSAQSAQPPIKFKSLVPDSLGGLKEAPSIFDRAQDQVSSIATIPNQLIDPNDPGIVIYVALNLPDSRIQRGE
jgi:hypothetical protein